MIKGIIFTLFIIGLISTAKADTIDFWHVYYNKVKIKEYNLYSKGTITIKKSDIITSDTITILYFRDTPCNDCETNVAIENGRHFVITYGKGKGTFNPIKISVNDLLKYHLKANKEIYEVFYHEEPIRSRADRMLIFRIKIE